MFLFFFFILLSSTFVHTSSALHLLLTAELLWVTLYALALTAGIIFNDLNLLALTFYFLVLSAVEFGTGLVLLLFQNVVLRSLSLTSLDSNLDKFSLRFLTKLPINRLKWKV